MNGIHKFGQCVSHFARPHVAVGVYDCTIHARPLCNVLEQEESGQLILCEQNKVCACRLAQCRSHEDAGILGGVGAERATVVRK